MSRKPSHIPGASNSTHSRRPTKPPATTFVDASDVLFDSTIRYDLSFFESLDQMVQSEPWLERDKAMIDPLKTIGIERGKPFNPDAKTRQILDDAMQEARPGSTARYDTLAAILRRQALVFPVHRGGAPERHRASGRRRIHIRSMPVAPPIRSPFSAPSIWVNPNTICWRVKDKDGNELNGSSSYRLNVPANAPVTQYWSMTVYDRETHAFIKNARRVGRSSQTPGLQKNDDGSVDIFFGPQAPPGGESNWVPTDSNGRFEVLARFYGPKKPLFDKTWQLPDIEKVGQHN